MWTASFVFTLARETGWPEHFIFWELPLSRLLQYQHCALRAHDVWTVPVAPRVAAGESLHHWSQNDPHKTTVSVYSLRARPAPTVSTPVT